MKSIDIKDARGSLAEYARQIGTEPLLVTDGGRPIAALIAVEDEDIDAQGLASNPRLRAILEEARAQRRAGLGLTTEDVRRELGLTSP